jgi:hypothetical protein
MVTTHVTIYKRFGRLGNNLIQVVHAVSYALQHQIDYVYLKEPHDYLSSQVINVSGTSTKFAIENSQCMLNNRFFYSAKIPNFKFDTKTESKPLFDQYIQPIYKHKDIHCLVPLDPASDNTLYIHIRSGDIFTKPHPLYVQPPIAYYNHIIAEQNPAHIILVSEDRLNPCIDALLAKYAGKITHVCNPGDPAKDIAVLCQASKIIYGFGTFSYYIMCVSGNLKTIWYPKYDIETEYSAGMAHIQAIYIPLPKYMKPGDWQNTPAQRKLMLTYQIP